MNEIDARAFMSLVKETVQKCTGQTLQAPLPEPDCRRLSLEIEEKTGLVIGWKSLKNYMAFATQESHDKTENPTAATLDTLARYVLNAPVTTEAQRKKQEMHYPYWFRYRQKFVDKNKPAALAQRPPKRWGWLMISGLATLAAFVCFFYWAAPANTAFNTHFDSVSDAQLLEEGWFLQAADHFYWPQKGINPGCLTLFTLSGDNWPQAGSPPGIKNLLLRPLSNSCFDTEIQFKGFIPEGNWQQAGLLLLEDTSFVGKSMRISLSYNDFFGGYSKPGEIIVQAVASYGKGYSNPEEFIHFPVFRTDESPQLVAENLRYSGLRIEKRGQQFRFLYTTGPTANNAYKEIRTHQFDIQPNYVGIFALKGFSDSTKTSEVCIDFFRLENKSCH